MRPPDLLTRTKSKPTLWRLRRSSKARYGAVRRGFAGCDNPTIQSVAPASSENWIEVSPYRQKDRDNHNNRAARRRTGQLPTCATILPTGTTTRYSIAAGY